MITLICGTNNYLYVPKYFYKWTRSFESEEIVQYHFSDINWAQGQNMSHLINCQCINGYLKTLDRKLKLVSCF